MAGQLFIVATPIGNLEDITYRALRVLREVSVIACEDTRQTRKLLDHFNIPTPQISYHDHNERERTAELLNRLQAGDSVALVTDAGTPLVSDPGFRLVAAAAAAKITVVPIPGASAPLAALAGSGLPSHAFRFDGFLPPKQGRRRAVLESLSDAEDTFICFEAPHRITEALADIVDILGPKRPVVAARELTKLHEEFLRGTAAEVHAQLASRASIKGEFTLLIGPPDRSRPATVPESPNEANSAVPDYHREFDEMLKAGIPRMDAIKALAKRHHLPKRDVYKLLESGS